MNELPDSAVTAALTFKVPQKVGWSVQSKDQSWTGGTLDGLTDCLAKDAGNNSLILSLSLIFESTENEGTVRSSSGILSGDGQ